MKTIYDENYTRLKKLAIVNGGVIRQDGRSQSGGYMDLVIERLPHLDNYHCHGVQAFSIGHYFEKNGDLCKDPEMILLLHTETKAVETLSFNQSTPPLTYEVYPEPGMVYPEIKKDLNQFLEEWLINLIEQGHGKNWINDNEVV